MVGASGRVLFYDSGIGGLSVLGAVRRRCPGLCFSYLFDHEGFPYGELTEREVVDRCVRNLTSMVSRDRFALVVVACNTASTVALPELRRCLDLPVVGVVPAVKPAARLSRLRRIGLLATHGTISRGYTQELISRFASGCEVISVGSARLVELAEAKLRGTVPDPGEISAEISPFLSPDGSPRVDVLVLGCTHFPFLAPEIGTILPGVRLLDSGDAIGRRVAGLLPQDAGCSEVAAGDRAHYVGEMPEQARSQYSGIFSGLGFVSCERFVP